MVPTALRHTMCPFYHTFAVPAPMARNKHLNLGDKE